MRPPKMILLVDGDETRLGMRRMVLEVRGGGFNRPYRVVTASSADEALNVLEGTVVEVAPELLMADLDLPGMGGNELVRRAKELHPEMRTMLLSQTVRTLDGLTLAADAFLPKGAGSAAEMLEKVRLLMCKKRGPKKKHGPGPIRLARVST